MSKTLSVSDLRRNHLKGVVFCMSLLYERYRHRGANLREGVALTNKAAVYKGRTPSLDDANLKELNRRIRVEQAG